MCDHTVMIRNMESNVYLKSIAKIFSLIGLIFCSHTAHRLDVISKDFLLYFSWPYVVSFGSGRAAWSTYFKNTASEHVI